MVPRIWRHKEVSQSDPLCLGPDTCPTHWYLYPFWNWQSASLTHWGRNKMAAIFHIFKCIFLNKNVWIWIKISLKFVPQGPINNIPALVQIMAWRLTLFFLGFNQHCGFISICEIWSHGMLPKGWHQSRIIRRNAGWKSTRDLRWKKIPPSIKPLLHALKYHLFVHFKGCGSTPCLFFKVPNIYLHHHITVRFTNYK